MSKKNLDEVTLEELLLWRDGAPFLFRFDLERFNVLSTELAREQPGCDSDSLYRARGLIEVQCYRRSLRLSQLGQDVPADQLMEPIYCGDIKPWGPLPTESSIIFSAELVLRYNLWDEEKLQ